MSANPEDTSPTSDLPAQQSTAAATSEKPNRTRRLRLSCRECRSKKLSCDRNLPCQRCVRSGRPEHCSFETGSRAANNLHYSDQIRELRAEVVQLKALLAKHESPGETLHDTDVTLRLDEGLDPEQNPINTELADPKEKSPRGYYRQHTLFQFFDEIPQLFPLIKETADEWFKPRGVSLRKDKLLKDAPSPEGSPLENLLPPKDDTDALVLFYLNHLEQLHRVVHIPTFKSEYANFWVPERARCPAIMALVLAMISISTCASASSSDVARIASSHRGMPPKWISACDKWLSQQSSKGRKLVFYQVSCLVYLAKRMNVIKKKRFWNEIGSLMQNAILDGLHRDPSPRFDSPYVREMKRRIWAVLRELDLQNTLEYQLPTLLHNIDSNVAASANLDDRDFDKASKELPTSRPLSQYTYMSYQSHSSRSWTLRLEISRRLFSTGFSKVLSYEDVLRYTHEITQALDSLPSWTLDEVSGGTGPKIPALTSAFLQFQLKECILAIHRPYLQKGNSRFSLSEILCYHTSRDILLLNRELAEVGIQSLTLLREDLLVASLSLTRITMLQPRGSTSVTMASSESTIDLLEQCLPFMEDRYLRCFYGEPWCPLTMCGAIMLLKIHLGRVSRHTAKSSCARRFLGLHYQHFTRQQPSLLNQQHPAPQEAVVNTSVASPQLPTPDATVLPESGWLDSRYLDLGIDSFDLDMDWDSAWGLPWPSLPNQSVPFEETFSTHYGVSAAGDIL